jgi:hypothetical protein
VGDISGELGRAGATNHVGSSSTNSTSSQNPYPDAVDAHAVGLFLFAQLYQRQAARPDTMDVWPGSDGPSNSGLNNSSCSSSIVNSVAVPMDTAPSFSRAGFTSNSPRSSSPHASGAGPDLYPERGALACQGVHF